jgi:hypothetical protein
MLPDLKDIIVPEQVAEQKRLLIQAIGFVCDYLTEWEEERPESFHSSDYVAKINDFFRDVDLTQDEDLMRAIKPSYDNDSSKISMWTTAKLKAEAIGYHETIYKVECYGTRDLLAYDGVMAELRKRGIEPKTQLTF